MTAIPIPSPTAAGMVLLPPDRFFTRWVPLAPDSAAAGQVELALENLSPFPVDQLFHGYVASPSRDAALVFATHRKQFSADQAAEWDEATVVLPAFVALLGDTPRKALIRIWRGAGALTGAAWDGRSELPIAVLARSADEAGGNAAMVAELRSRTGLADAAVEEFAGEPVAAAGDDASYAFTIATKAGPRSGSLDRANAASADVREKAFLTERRRLGRRDLYLWRGFLACLVGLGLLILAEVGVAVAGVAMKRLKTGIDARAPAVAKIETAQTLSQRIEDLSTKRLMPVEMLTVLNRHRPGSVSFNRVATTGINALDVDIQTPNAAEAGVYEAALRSEPELASVEMRLLQSREGNSSFALSVQFKPDAFTAGGAK